MNLAASILARRIQVWIPFLIGAALLLLALGSSDRIPTGDAPHLLAITEKLAAMLRHGEVLDFFEAWGSLVTPHPPAGYLVPLAFSILGFGSATPIMTGLLGLALAWHGMVLLVQRETGEAVIPWLGGLLVFSSAITWGAVEHMVWDLLAAGCVSGCVGHLHASDGFRNKGHAMFFGLFMGLGFVTKFTFPGFLILPVLFAGWAMLRFRSFSGAAAALTGFLIVCGPWMLGHGDAVLAYVLHSSGAATGGVVHSISDSPASAWTYRFTAENLLYYPTVLRDILGWPGLLLVGLATPRAWGAPAGRWATWSILSGALVLTFAGENQARYVLPALPLLGAMVEVGVRPGFSRATSRFGLICGLGATLPALWGSWMTTSSTERAPPSRDQTHAVESLYSWGAWPWPATPFRPISNPMDTWRIDEALVALAVETGPGSHQIGLLTPRDVRMPPVSSYAWRAGQRGLDWDVASIVARGPGGRPMVFVGPLKPLGHQISRRFKVAYAIHPKGTHPALLTALGAQAGWGHDLPSGLRGTIFRIPSSAWDTPAGQVLQRDPLDG
jgi:hypothetical protein